MKRCVECDYVLYRDSEICPMCGNCSFEELKEGHEVIKKYTKTEKAINIPQEEKNELPRTTEVKKCPGCGNIYLASKNICPDCNVYLMEIPSFYNDTNDKCIPRCPTCSSTHLKKITNTKRAFSFLAWGFASDKIGKQFECMDCGYKW